MKIVFCNIALAGCSGTELFLWDLARGLKRRGHDVGVFSPRLGTLAEAFCREGIPVWDNPQAIEGVPDLLHCQHALESWRLLAAFPNTPAIYVCHDAKVWFDSPPPPSLVSRYVAVDTYCRERMVRESGCLTDFVEVIHNGADLQKFRQKEAITPQPRRALLFVSESSESRHVHCVRAVCRTLGLPLDEIGGAVGKKVPDPENLLPQYDLVFGKARCALEAMACGCAAILVGPEGIGSMVMPADFDVMRARNFGRSLLRPSFDEQLLAAEVRRYDPTAVAEVCRLVRARCGVEFMVDAFERLYTDILKNPQGHTLPRPESLLRYGARLLAHLDEERKARENPPSPVPTIVPNPPAPSINPVPRKRRWWFR